MRLVQLENGKIDYQSRIEVGVTTSQINLTGELYFFLIIICRSLSIYEISSY